MSFAPAYTPAPGAAFFTPHQDPPVGTALQPNPPTLFTPIKLRGLTFQNRIWVAPMCTYSAPNGAFTPFHLMHLGGFAYRGASLTITEATSVLPNGRISPQDAGLWDDSQIAGLKAVADLVHSQGQKLGVQLAHGGRKASTVAPWLRTRGEPNIATAEVGGWPDDVMGPSAIPFDEGFASPREMTLQDIHDVVNGFRDAARRALAAGVDVLEIHGAHGYLISSFLSPLSNRRTDDYGGSFENRTRILVEIIKAVRSVMPDEAPLLVRVSSTEWMEKTATESWTVEQTIRLAKMLPELGVDLLDVSSGGNNKDQRIADHNEYQTGIAAIIRKELHAAGIKGMLIGAVGMITEAEQAKQLTQQKQEGDNSKEPIEIQDEQGSIAKADIVLIGRQFLREPEWVLKVAHRLGVNVKWPVQYSRAQFPKNAKV